MSGNLGHTSGRFFTMEGLQVSTDLAHYPQWTQPIINQPEVGVLGILVKEFDGVLHCLMQVKMEPGNVNTVQLSPTVQATRSNYTGAHGGRGIVYLEYFTEPGRSRILVDSLQSEQASWFLRKRNRNMVVEITEDVTPHEDFCWLSIGQLHRLLLLDNIVNMDARTVLACIPFDAPNGRARGVSRYPYRESLLRSMADDEPSLHSTGDILSWLTEIRSRHELRQLSIPLREIRGWHRSDTEIAHEKGKYFRIIAADVGASNREVTSWTQPLLEPVERGRVAVLVRRIDGVLHLLVQTKLEAGVRDVAELGPTVQCLPRNTEGMDEQYQPRYLDYVLDAPPEAIVYDTVQSEEGGRFYHAENRYQIIEVGQQFDLDVPSEFAWLTVSQLTRLMDHSNYLNVQMRSLLASLHATW